ncbi:RNase H domain protein [Ophiocordyceps camponoti-floridani]|uniref:ribonuclease H n=1 Tax=Ophiocordyceps camponoti-floridani TaxID=2030778 RepID=A0A8H4Q158_9HYPO|nr:RNase H domain protein [Ophiocordyceps camponoti-floridani]
MPQHPEIILGANCFELPSGYPQGLGPIELPDGRLICRPHGLTVCGYCCVDFNFDNEEFSEGSDDELEMDGPRRGSGRVFPTKFIPPSTTSTPRDLFGVGVGLTSTTGLHSRRFIRRDDPKQLLIYADGACLGNGQANPKAGWAFVFKPSKDSPSGSGGFCSGRLENEGPFGHRAAQTSNRAELRAILAALRFRVWYGEGFNKLVFATDSEYVAEGATSWLRLWIRNGWKTSGGDQVRNKDLWEALLGEVEHLSNKGLKIQFWRIPRELNEVADGEAKRAARGEDRGKYGSCYGVMC